MYSFTYTHSYLLIHVFISYTHSHIHSRIFIHVYSFINSFTYTHSYIHLRILIHIFIYVYSFTYSFHILIHIFLSLNASILLRNWNYSNWVIHNKVMAFSCQLVNLHITLGTVCITQFSGLITSCLKLYICSILKLRY